MRRALALAVEPNVLALPVLGGEPAAELEVEAAAAHPGDDEARMVHVRAEHQRAALPPSPVRDVGIAELVLRMVEPARVGEGAQVGAHAALEVWRGRDRDDLAYELAQRDRGHYGLRHGRSSSVRSYRARALWPRTGTIDR